MLAGVVDYKLCDRDYDCESCPFDGALHGQTARDFSAAVLKHELGAYGNSDPQVIQSCEVPGDLFFHPGHTWARIEEGGLVRMGLDDFGQRLMGRAYAVDLPEPNTFVTRGERCWRFTHQAGRTDLLSPISGKVRLVNTNLAQRPTLINRDPYGEGWIALIEPANLKHCLKRLLYRVKVREWIERDNTRLVSKANEVISRSTASATTLPDGGELTKDFKNGLTAKQMLEVINCFFPSAVEEETDRNNSFLIQNGR